MAAVVVEGSAVEVDDVDEDEVDEDDEDEAVDEYEAVALVACACACVRSGVVAATFGAMLVLVTSCCVVFCAEPAATVRATSASVRSNAIMITVFVCSVVC